MLNFEGPAPLLSQAEFAQRNQALLEQVHALLVRRGFRLLVLKDLESQSSGQKLVKLILGGNLVVVDEVVRIILQSFQDDLPSEVLIGKVSV